MDYRGDKTSHTSAVNNSLADRDRDLLFEDLWTGDTGTSVLSDLAVSDWVRIDSACLLEDYGKTYSTECTDLCYGTYISDHVE